MNFGIDLHAATWSWAAEEWSSVEGYDSAFEVIGVPAPATGLLILIAATGMCRRALSASANSSVSQRDKRG
jgi:hypothetical protein